VSDDTIIDGSIAERMAEFRRLVSAAFDEQQTRPSLSIEPIYDRGAEVAGPGKLDGAMLTVEYGAPQTTTAEEAQRAYLKLMQS
jgi:hypothetical protein